MTAKHGPGEDGDVALVHVKRHGVFSFSHGWMDGCLPRAGLSQQPWLGV